MTEAELFAAYHTPYGYMTTCACGDVIEAADADESTVARAISFHQESTVHEQWSAWRAELDKLQRPALRPCPCGGHE